MKKIYMILAAITLLSMSLNAQQLPKIDRSQLHVAYTNNSSSFHNMLRSVKGMAGILPEVNPNGKSSSNRQSRAPLKLNSDETTVGPFTGDYFDPNNGIGFGAAYNQAQMILIETDLLRSEYADYIGEDIIGFRLALAGDATNTVLVGEFIAWPTNSDGSWDQNNRYTWSIGELTNPAGQPYDQYERITSTSDLESGAEYLIVYETDNVAFDGSLTTLDAGHNVISVTRNGTVIESNAATDAATFTITANGNYYTIKSKSGYYIGRTSSSNGFNSNATTVYNNSITFSGNNVVIRGRSSTATYASDTYYLRFNSSSGSSNYRFRYYNATSQQNIQLYKKVTVTPTAPSYVALQDGQWHEFYLDNPVTFNVGDDNAGLSLGYTYIQYPTGTTGENLFPIGVNPQSTTHDHYAYLTYTSGSGGIVITVPSYNTMFQTITITDNNTGTVLDSWSSSESTVTSGGYTYYEMPTGWTLSNVYMFTYTTSGYTFGYLSSASQASITIDPSVLNGSTNVSVSIDGAALDDGQYVDVNGDSRSLTSGYLFSETWNPVDLSSGSSTNTGFVPIDFSQYGDLAVQLIFKSHKTPAPTITGQVDPNNENNYVITATGDGTVTLTVGNQTVSGNGSASITIPRTDVDQTVTATATAQDGNLEESDPTTENFTVPKLVTDDPVITYVVNGDNVVITATGDGTVTLTVGNQTVSGNGSASITVPRTDVDQTVTASATAQESGKAVSNTVTENIPVPALPVPALTAPTDGTTVNVGTNTGTGVSTTITVSGENLTGDLTISVVGTGFTVDPTTISATDANNGTTITVTYNGYNENATGTLTITSSNGEVSSVTVNLTASFEAQPITPVTGLLRLHMLLCDQLKANIPDDNTHADAYRYVLKYEPQGGETKESSPVKIDIQKTECEVKGYYTKAEIDGDTDGALTMGVLTADVQFDLSDDNDEIEFYDLQAAANRYPTLGEDYVTKLERTTNFTYVEMLKTSDDYEHEYPNGEHHYYDDSTPILTGTYTNGFMSYAPSLSTWGIQRRYFEDDGLDNTYGAPIWRTRVGDVQIQGKPSMQKQVINAGTPNEAPNPYTSWTEGGKNYSLFFLGVNAQGTLPNTEGTYGTNIDYEPYMFRVFVSSPTGKLRKYVKVMGEGGGYYLEDGGAIAADEKYCVGSFLIDDGWHASDLFFSKTIPSPNALRDGGNSGFDPDAWDGIMKFAGEDGLKKDDVKVYVRFYYMVEGWDANRDGEARPGNGAEGSGDPDNPGTFVYELFGNAEVVGVTYVNAQGMTSDKPFSGMNIIVTRYSDGTTTTRKVMR